MSLRFLLAAILSSTIAVTARAATIADLDPSRLYQTGTISISGNQKFSTSDVLAVMQTKTRPIYQLWKRRPQFLPATFKEDITRIKRFYQAHGYYSASAAYDLDLKGDLVNPRIRVSEGEPIKVKTVRLAVEGSAPTPNVLAPSFKLPLKAADVFAEGPYQLGQSALLDLYMHRGYAFAQARRQAQVFIGTRQAYVWYVVTPGKHGVFGPTIVQGTNKVSPKLILRELTYKPGQEFDSGKIAQTRTKVVGLNLFRSVEFLPQTSQSDPRTVPILVKVQEKPKHSVNLALGYNTQSQFVVAVQGNDYNFMGGGRQLSLLAQYSNIVSTLDLKLTQPYFFSPKSSFIADASVYQEVYQTYTLNAAQLQPYESYQFNQQLTGILGWRFAYLKFNSLDRRTIAAIGGVRRSGFVSGPYGQLIWNTTEDPFNPQQGEIATLYANTASHAFGSDYRYWRAFGELRKYHLLGWQTVLATRFKLGFEHSFGTVRDIPLSDRFYSGGEGSVRGYGLRRIGPLSAANQPLGGISLVEGSLELRRPLFWKVSGAIFFDCGQVSNHSYRVPIDALQCGYGPAVSVTTPVGPMRLDLGFPLKKPHGDSSWQVYFSIGQYF
jgi:outer membrane protein insertion porin family